MVYIKIAAVILLMSVSVLLAVSCRSDEQDIQPSAETSPEEISAPESEEPDAVPELQIDSTEAEYMKRNNITDMNEWLHSQGLDPFATTVFFEDCVYMCDPDAEIGENRADYVKGTKDELLFSNLNR